MSNLREVKVIITELQEGGELKKYVEDFRGLPEEIVPYCSGMLEVHLLDMLKDTREGTTSMLTVSFIMEGAS